MIKATADAAVSADQTCNLAGAKNVIEMPMNSLLNRRKAHWNSKTA